MDETALQHLVTEAVREVRVGMGEGNVSGGKVVTLVDALLCAAILDEASDIHLEPMLQGGLRIRMRMDGMLHVCPVQIPPSLAPVVLSRLKVMAGIDIGKRNRPQDGQLRHMYHGRRIDMRVAVLPVVDGERMVVRILDAQEQFLGCQELGFSERNLTLFRQLIHRQTGLLLLCGPMNSGKTTTLYAALSELNDPSCNIMTLEDPVERRMDGVSQIQIHPETGLTFVVGLRAALRQDAQKILLGEIRDHETAEMAVRIALTGHALFSTLHTEDAVSAVFRMAEMSVPRYLLAATLSGVIAQRLVRRICPHCRERYTPGEKEAAQLGAFYQEGLQLTRGRGCAHCRGTGYSGRMAIREVLPVSERIRGAILREEDKAALYAAAAEDGVETLWQDGVVKVIRGETTLDEVGRALYG